MELIIVAAIILCLVSMYERRKYHNRTVKKWNNWLDSLSEKESEEQS